MKVTTKHKVYAAVVTLAAASFLADRAFFAEAEAAPGAAAQPATAAVPATPVAAKSDAAAQAVLARHSDAPDLSALATRLDAASAGLDPERPRDAFQVPRAWLKHDAEDPSAGNAARAAAAAQKFAQSRHLTAVFVPAQDGPTSEAAAIVDGRMVTVGQTLDGFRLVSLGKRSATWEANGVQVTLALRAPAP